MAGVTLVDRDEHEIVEDPLGRKVHVDDFRQRLPDHRQEDPLARQPQVVVLHRRHADDGRQIGRAFALGDAGEVKDREIVGLRIEAGMIAERSLATAFAGA